MLIPIRLEISVANELLTIFGIDRGVDIAQFGCLSYILNLLCFLLIEKRSSLERLYYVNLFLKYLVGGVLKVENLDNEM